MRSLFGRMKKSGSGTEEKDVKMWRVPAWNHFEMKQSDAFEHLRLFWEKAPLQERINAIPEGEPFKKVVESWRIAMESNWVLVFIVNPSYDHKELMDLELGVKETDFDMLASMYPIINGTKEDVIRFFEEELATEATLAMIGKLLERLSDNME